MACIQKKPDIRTGPDSRREITRRCFLRQTLSVGSAALLWPFWGCGEKQETAAVTASMDRPLTMGTAVDLYTIDPAVGFDFAIGNTLKSLYDALFRHVGNPPKAVPWLVEGYELSKDARTWRFRIDPRAVFHNGAPVTAHAVKYSAERVLRIGKGPSGLFERIITPDGIRVAGDRVVEMTLTHPVDFFAHLLTWLFIVNPEEVESHKGKDDGRTWLKSHEAGSGPFTIDLWRPGERYCFKALAGYWRGWPKKSHLAGYERIVIKPTEERIDALESGRVDLVDWMPPKAFAYFKAKPGYHVVDDPGMVTFELRLNNKVGYTADANVRRAICHAFDYGALLDIWQGRGVLLNGPLPPGLSGLRKGRAVYRLDMDKARQALGQSPWPSGGFDLDYVYVAGLEEERQTGDILRKQLAELDIRVNIIPMAWADAVASFQDPQTSPPVFPLYNITAYPDPDNYLWNSYHSSKAGELSNPGHFTSQRVDTLLERARFSTNRKMRETLYTEVQHILLQDAATVFGIAVKDTNIYADCIQGMHYCPVMGSATPFYDCLTACGTGRGTGHSSCGRNDGRAGRSPAVAERTKK